VREGRLRRERRVRVVRKRRLVSVNQEVIKSQRASIILA